MNDDVKFLRIAIHLAADARAHGEDPFGAVLVYNGEVVHQMTDRSVAMADPTFHAETALISEYCRMHKTMNLEGYTLYSSTEPCMMCSGAIHWAKISRVVFSVSQEMLQQKSDGKKKSSCSELVNSGKRKVEVVGPLIPEEGLAVFEGYTFVPKAVRCEQRVRGRGEE